MQCHNYILPIHYTNYRVQKNSGKNRATEELYYFRMGETWFIGWVYYVYFSIFYSVWMSDSITVSRYKPIKFKSAWNEDLKSKTPQFGEITLLFTHFYFLLHIIFQFSIYSEKIDTNPIKISQRNHHTIHNLYCFAFNVQK